MTASRHPPIHDDEMTCPVCYEPSAMLLCTTNGFDIYRCPKCATDFVAPMPDAATLRGFDDRPECFEAGEWGGYSDYEGQTEPALPSIEAILDSFPPDGAIRSILDVGCGCGCGFGSHLQLAYDRGWKCFGIEPSAHARSVIEERHGEYFFVVEDADHLLPHEFDLVLLLDVIEELREPYTLLCTLFAKGAITPQTLVVVSTPNARSAKACAAPTEWAYRHPSSHLVYFSAQSLLLVLQELRFTSIQIDGVHPFIGITDARFSDEVSELNDSLRSYEGLLAQASGSDFAEFMRERYVPGTWSKLAEYEHVPRYRLASGLAAGRSVLDFGCGTGYGSAILAASAASVLAIDIDEAAIQWARRHHRAEHVVFDRCSDAGVNLPERSFDLITCFEVIEYVHESTQVEIVDNLSRLLREDGILLISTPNPEVSALYGHNPYHLRELAEGEFLGLLKTRFQHVRLARQSIVPAVVISGANGGSAELRTIDDCGAPTSTLKPAIFIAMCSHSAAAELPTTCFVDGKNDYIAEQLRHSSGKDKALFDQYKWREALASSRAESDSHPAAMAEMRRLQDVLANKDEALSVQKGEIQRLQDVLIEKDRNLMAAEAGCAEVDRITRELAARDVQIVALSASLTTVEESLAAAQSCRVMRLATALKQPPSLQKARTVVRLSAAMLLPKQAKRMLDRVFRTQSATAVPSGDVTPYVARQPKVPASGRPRILHVIANFMTGGSSRLVVDLYERLGHRYEQQVVTSFAPNPPNYVNVPIREIRLRDMPSALGPLMDRFAPSLIHVHYWGDFDEPWYREAFRYAEARGIPVIENVNTPVAPYRTQGVVEYIFVSNYVRATFGVGLEGTSSVIYPGSDLDLFEPPKTPPTSDCIGMVYRLEPDKLNEAAIKPFIYVVRNRPSVHALIVGSGSLEDCFRSAVAAAGLTESFTFTGYVAYEKLPALYARMSVFVAPVWKESFGQVSSFAMNMRIPVAGYDVGALGEILAPPDLLAPPGDAEALGKIILALLDDPARRAIIGEENRMRARSLFSVQAMAKEYDGLYQRVIARH